MKTEASRLFDELNTRYWGGRLPRYRVIQRADLGCWGLCDNARRTILLAPHPSREALRLTLLHEMCHIGTGPGYGHGPRFLRKLRRLIELGETALHEEDLERYDGTVVERHIAAAKVAGTLLPEVPFRDMLKSDIEDLAASNLDLRLRWPRVARALAQQYKMSVPQLRRVAPWAEREWRRQRGEARELQRAEARFRSRSADSTTSACPVPGGPGPGSSRRWPPRSQGVQRSRTCCTSSRTCPV